MGEIKRDNQYLSFNDDEGRYGIKQGDTWVNSGIHCGEGFKVLINDMWVNTSMEYFNGEWYLTGTDLKGNLENIIVKG